MYLVPETNLVNSFDPSSVANLAFFPVEFSKLMAETEIYKKIANIVDIVFKCNTVKCVISASSNFHSISW